MRTYILYTQDEESSTDICEFESADPLTTFADLLLEKGLAGSTHTAVGFRPKDAVPPGKAREKWKEKATQHMLDVHARARRAGRKKKDYHDRGSKYVDIDVDSVAVEE